MVVVLVVAFATKDDDEFRVVVVRRLHVKADVSMGVRIDDTPWSASFAPRVMMMRETLILRPPHASPLVVKVVVVKVAISLKKGDDGLFCRSALRHTYNNKERF